LSAGLLSALLSREAIGREAVSAALGRSAARAACGSVGHTVPATVLALTKGVALTMLMDRLKIVLAVLLIAGTAGVGLLALSRRADAGPPGEGREQGIPPRGAREGGPPDAPGIHRAKNGRAGTAAELLTHRVTHPVLAHAIGRPLPRWADEGAAVLAEDDQEHRRHDLLMTRIIDERRAMPLRRLFALNEYPREVMTLFAQGY